jgi:replicative DNA helicase
MRSDVMISMEAQVIGAVLGNPTLFSRASFLHPDAFTDAGCATLWKIISQTIMSGRAVSQMTLAVNHSSVIDQLGGMAYLGRLVAMGESVVPVFGDAVDRLHEELQWRRISQITARLDAVTKSRDKTPDQVLAGLQQLARTHLEGGSLTTRSKREVARAAIEAAKETRDMTVTGIESLDLMMHGGLHSRRLYGLGGLFGRGKTILLGTISDNVNLQQIPHLFISLETPPEDIELRSCARHLNLNSSAIHDTGDVDHATFLADSDEYIETIPDCTQYDYSPQATIDEIHRKILAAKSRHGIKGFIIDYWQLIRGKEKGQSEESHLRDCADRLAAICRTEDIWGIVAAQVDERGRLRISDALYQSASLYLRLVREENETASYFVTEKSNYTRYADTGSESISTMVFDDAVGPHFRNTISTDIGDLAREDKIEID